MDPTVLAASIGFVATISAAIIGKSKVSTYKKKMDSLEVVSWVRFMREGETFKEILPRVDSICMYTVNSFELLHTFNTMFEQDTTLKINKIKIMVRKKDDESAEDRAILEGIISLWKKWVDKKRIKELEIVAYDHDPDHYYTIIGRRLVICGQVLFDELKPTGTNVNYLPLVFTDANNIGQQVIENYHEHFKNVYMKYKESGLLYNSRKK